MIHRTLFTTRGAVLLLAAALLAIVAFQPNIAGATGVCKDCTKADNDTSSTPGRIDPGDAIAVAMAPWIAFVNSNGHVACAAPAFPGWSIEPVDSFAQAGGVSMDASQTPVIAYHDEHGTLLVAQRDATGNWSPTPVGATGLAGSTVIVRVPNGLGVAFLDSAAGVLEYAERNSTGLWSIEPVAPVNGSEAYPSLAVSGSGRAISFYDLGRGWLWFAQKIGGTWIPQVVDTSANVGGWSSLVSTPGGFGIAYYDFTHANLRYAFQTPGGWVTQVVDGANGTHVGRSCSAVALGESPADQIGIAYHDAGRGTVNYAYLQGSLWTIAVLDTSGGAVRAGVTHVAPDTVGIAYDGPSSTDLYYRTFRGDLTAVPQRRGGAAAVGVEWLRGRGATGGTVRFGVPVAGAVRVAIYDGQGRLTAMPLHRDLPAGAAEARWDGRDERGRLAPSGVYFARVDTPAGSGAAPAVFVH